MASDHGLQLRKAIVDWLRADSVVTSFVGDRVHSSQPPAQPEWPWIRWGFPISADTEQSDADGAEIQVTIHAFAKTSPTLGPGEAVASRLANAIARSLDNAPLVLEADPDTGRAALVTEIYWRGNQTLTDSEGPDAYHMVIAFDVTVLEPK